MPFGHFNQILIPLVKNTHAHPALKQTSHFDLQAEMHTWCPLRLRECYWLGDQGLNTNLQVTVYKLKSWMLGDRLTHGTPTDTGALVNLGSGTEARSS